MLNIQVQLENELVKIKPLKSSDFDALFQAASDSKIWEQHPAKDRYQLKGFTTYFNEAIASKGAHLVLDKNTNSVIGSSRYEILDMQQKIVEIGWTFLIKSYWGGLYNRALKTLMVNPIIDQGGIVVLYIGVSNIRSQKAAEKIGAKRVSIKEFDHCYPEPSINWTYIITNAI